MPVTSEKRQELISQYRTHEKDCGSSEVQVSILTERIKVLTEHLKKNPKDHASQRGLLMMVGKRSALLRYLRKRKYSTYRNLIERLGIRR